jgi:ankyrin repeat protein
MLPSCLRKFFVLSGLIVIGFSPNTIQAKPNTAVSALAIGQAPVTLPKTPVTQAFLTYRLQDAVKNETDQHENDEWVRQLLKQGADPGVPGQLDSHSALSLALAMNKLSLAREMLPYLHKDSFLSAQRVIFYAARQGDLNIVNALLNFTEADKSPLAPHSPATECEIVQAVEHGHLAIVQRLYALRPTCQPQALLSSLSSGQTEIFNWLLAQVDDSTKSNLTSQNAMEAAIKGGKIALVQQLVKLGNTNKDQARLAIKYHQLPILQQAITPLKNANLKNQLTYLINTAAQYNHVDILNYLNSLNIAIEVKSDAEHCDLATHIAAENGSLEALQWLLQHNAPIIDDCTGNTLLHKASFNNQIAIVNWLFSNKASPKINIDAQNNEGNTALHIASDYRHIALVDLLLSYGANRNIQNQEGNTALHLVSHYYLDNKNRALIYSLLANPIEESGINIQNKKGHTPLSLSLSMPDEGTIRTLLAAGTKAYLADYEGLSPLHQLAKSNTVIPNSIDLLLANGATINQQDYKGKTALHYAIESAAKTINNNTDELESDNPITIKSNFLEQLMKYQPDINLADKQGISPLAVAIQNHDFDTALKFIEQGANVNAVDAAGNTILHYAAGINDSQAVIKSLVAKGAKVNVVNKQGNPAIFQAATVDNLKLLKSLGADINIINTNKETIISVFSTREDKKNSLALIIASLALGVNANQLDNYRQNALHRAIRFNAPELSAALVKANINLNQADQDGNTPLMIAVRTRSLYNIKLLIEHGANINLANRFGKTALQQSIELAEPELFNILLAAKADINTKDSDQRSPLLTALANAQADIAAKLIALGTDVNIRSKGEWTALHYASQLGNTDLVKSLLAAGAVNGIKTWGNQTALDLAGNKPALIELLQTNGNIDYFQTTDAFGNTALHWAVRTQNFEQVKYLLQQGVNVNARNYYAETPLVLALKTIPHNADLASSITQALIAAGANTQAVDSNGNTVLYYALQNAAPITIIDLLLAKQADLNAVNHYQEALTKWLPRQSLTVLKRLYSLQPEWLNRTENSEFLWSWVVYHPERLALTEWLLSQKVNPNVAGSHEPIAMVSALNAQAYELLEPLRQAGGKLQLNAQDNSALDWLLANHNWEASLVLLNQADFKIDLNADPNLNTARFKTITHQATNEGAGLVKRLLELGLSIDNQNTELMQDAVQSDADLLVRLYQQAGLAITNLMHTAASHNALRCLDYLKTQGISVNELDSYQSPPLFTAISDRQLEAAEWLVANGADIHLKNEKGETAIEQLSIYRSNFLLGNESQKNYVKALKKLLPDAHISYKLMHELVVKRILDPSTLTILEEWPNTLAVVEQERLSQVERNEYPSDSLIETLLNTYVPDKQNYALTLLKRLYTSANDWQFIHKQPNSLVNNAAYPELLKTVYELDHHYTESSEVKALIEAIFTSSQATALESFTWLIAQPDTAIEPDILNLLITSNDLNKDTVLAKNTQYLYESLIKHLYPNQQAKKLSSNYVYNMLEQTNFTHAHLAIVLQQLSITDIPVEFFKKDEHGIYTTLPGLAEPKLREALLNYPSLKTQLQQDGIFILADQYQGLANLKSLTDYLLRIGANINQQSNKQGSIASLWLGQSLIPLSDEIEPMTVANIAEGLNYLKSKGYNWQSSNNLLTFLLADNLKKIKEAELLPLINMLLALNPAWASQANNGKQALHYITASTELSLDWQRRLIQRLLRENINLNAQDSDSNTPLLLALKAGNLGIADWLVEQGADINIKNQENETAFSVSLAQLTQINTKSEKNIEIDEAASEPQILLNLNAGIPISKQEYLQTYLPPLIERLLKKGADVNNVDKQGNTPLHYVALQPCSIDTPDLCQMQISFAQALLKANAPVNSQNLDGDTPLSLSAYGGNTALADLLLKAKAQPDIVNQIGNTALLTALFSQHLAIADLLISAGADINKSNSWHITALDYARQTQAAGIAAVMQQKYPTLTWDESLITTQQTPTYIYDLLANQRLVALQASPIWQSSNTDTATPSIYYDANTGNSLLHMAAQANAQAYIQHLLKKLDYPLDILNQQRQTPLHLAIQANAQAAIDILIANGANPQLQNLAQQDALMLAVKTNNMLTVNTLLQATDKAHIKLAINQQDQDGKSLLHYALEQHNNALVKLLLDKGINTELVDQYQHTALLYAAQQASLPTIKLLVEHKADLNAKDKRGRTPLLYTTWYYVHETKDTFKQQLSERLAVIDYLLAQGADVNAVDAEQNTLLHLGIPVYEMGQHLISKGVDIRKTNQEGETALFQVVRSDYPERNVTEYLQTLLDKGLDINTRNNYGETILNTSVRHNKFKVLLYLLEHGAEPNILKESGTSQAGFTLPMYIVDNQSISYIDKIKILSALKTKDADFNALNDNGENLLFLAVRKLTDNYTLINWLIQQGVKPDIVNKKQQSLIHLLVEGNVSIVNDKQTLQATRQQLLEAFTKHNVPINARDMNGKTALHYALYKDINNQDWASPLLKVGINPNIQDNLDTSALALVVSKTDNNSLNLDLVNLLLDNKANPNLRDSLGETVLFKAYRINNQDLIKLLLAKGANPTIKNYYGKLASETE